MSNNIEGLTEEQAEVWKTLQQTPWDKVCEIIDEDLFRNVGSLVTSYSQWLEKSKNPNNPPYQPPEKVVELARRCNYDPVELSVTVFETLVKHRHEIDSCITKKVIMTKNYLHLSEKLHREAIDKLKEEQNGTH